MLIAMRWRLRVVRFGQHFLGGCGIPHLSQGITTSGSGAPNRARNFFVSLPCFLKAQMLPGDIPRKNGFCDIWRNVRPVVSERQQTHFWAMSGFRTGTSICLNFPGGNVFFVFLHILNVPRSCLICCNMPTCNSSGVGVSVI